MADIDIRVRDKSMYEVVEVKLSVFKDGSEARQLRRFGTRAHVIVDLLCRFYVYWLVDVLIGF